jgi:hypothetical protein
VLFLISVGVAVAYLGSISVDLILMTLATVAGSGAGTLAGRRPWRPPPPTLPALWGVAVVLVLMMTLIIIPDAVSGTVPGGAAQSELVMGTPVYVGGYMDTPLGHAEGAALTVSFAETNASMIQRDNYISAGLGVHSAGCCVDGIDYAYRFDLYLFHGGSESLAATVWEVCDDNLACGGHSWRLLLLAEERPLAAVSTQGNVTLRMEWEERRVAWSYSLGAGGLTNFTSFEAPTQENPNFNTGVAIGGSLTAEQSAAYFFQFGISSRYPIGHGGWGVEFYCPAVEDSGGWECIPHARTVQGEQSYWKVLWRWGEDYPNVSIEGGRKFFTLVRYSAGSGAGSYQILW